MAIKMIASYQKKAGLPGFSSHQFSVSVETELSAVDDIAAESTRLYQLLQSNVDEQMLKTGFVPPGNYGMDPQDDNPCAGRGDSASSTTAAHSAGSAPGTNWQRGTAWKCSDKQRDLILKLVEEHQLDKADVEALAVERFAKGVRLLNKVEASGLIDELLDTHGGGNSRHGAGQRRNGSAYNGAHGGHGGRSAA